MTVFQALVLGILQGLAEFLPISSSAHLTLAPWLFGWRDPGLAFDVALHFGTLVAVLWYFRDEWARLIAAAGRIARRRGVETETEWRVIFLIVATIPAVIAGLLLEDYAETVFRTPALTAVALAVMGLLLWVVDARAARERRLGELRTRDALLIGLAQVLALVPGVSRSGATMTAGRALRLDRPSAAVFSFLMLMPVTAGAAILKVPDAIREHGLSVPMIVGVIAAALSSWAAIAILLRLVQRHSLAIFAVYRLVLAAGVLGMLWMRSRHG